jgi:hypothetical protein
VEAWSDSTGERTGRSIDVDTSSCLDVRKRPSIRLIAALSASSLALATLCTHTETSTSDAGPIAASIARIISAAVA